MILNLERAVQISDDIASIIIAEKKFDFPETMAESFLVLHEKGVLKEALAKSLRNSVGFRNIAVHEYHDLDWAIVYSIATEKLEDFKQFILIVNDLIHLDS